ncbi:hypothetical protein M2103_001570 [Ereboglobus sp. PH5-5]|uniref:hypothetical protein n=1 Tax=Ereboglobus sp. PH5-5 TaxID=2940529 RepID=UPI002405F7FF|nr:hypothetical protein [Ereboglobus sp. PH5-5]MDF9833347.1 hypothetical protein [Ereboglobus sp. PH5-5]
MKIKNIHIICAVFVLLFNPVRAEQFRILINQTRNQIKTYHKNDKIEEFDDLILVTSKISNIPCQLLYQMSNDHSFRITYEFKTKEGTKYNEGLVFGKKLICDFLKPKDMCVDTLKINGMLFSKADGDPEDLPCNYLRCYDTIDVKYRYTITIASEKECRKSIEPTLAILNINISKIPPMSPAEF